MWRQRMRTQSCLSKGGLGRYSEGNLESRKKFQPPTSTFLTVASHQPSHHAIRVDQALQRARRRGQGGSRRLHHRQEAPRRQIFVGPQRRGGRGDVGLDGERRQRLFFFGGDSRQHRGRFISHGRRGRCQRRQRQQQRQQGAHCEWVCCVCVSLKRLGDGEVDAGWR